MVRGPKYLEEKTRQSYFECLSSSPSTNPLAYQMVDAESSGTTVGSNAQHTPMLTSVGQPVLWLRC